MPKGEVELNESKKKKFGQRPVKEFGVVVNDQIFM